MFVCLFVLCMRSPKKSKIPKAKNFENDGREMLQNYQNEIVKLKENTQHFFNLSKKNDSLRVHCKKLNFDEKIPISPTPIIILSENIIAEKNSSHVKYNIV